LLKQTVCNGFAPTAILADKAYLGRSNLKAIEDAGAEPFIPFKSNSTGRSFGTRAWRRAFHFFQMNREAFEARYHKRSNIEAAISSIKKKLGETIRSRTRIAQENELLCKLIAYNLTVVIHEMFENGINPAWVTTGLPACEPQADSAPNPSVEAASNPSPP
jgi:transposase